MEPRLTGTAALQYHIFKIVAEYEAPIWRVSTEQSTVSCWIMGYNFDKTFAIFSPLLSYDCIYTTCLNEINQNIIIIRTLKLDLEDLNIIPIYLSQAFLIMEKDMK